MKAKSVNPLRNPLIIALDVDKEFDALKLADELQSVAGAFKLGPRLCYRYGQSIVHKIAKLAPVFVDNKFFDIPSTMESAVRACFESGASLVTVHSLSGFEALQKLAQLETEFQKERAFKILNVTILTSWDQNSFPANFQSMPVSMHVEKLVEMVRKSGLNGIVCSAQDLKSFDHQDLFVVTPGIRLESDAPGDQKRIMTPQRAIRAGAQGLVVARPIIEAPNPFGKATQFLSEINSVNEAT